MQILTTGKNLDIGEAMRDNYYVKLALSALNKPGLSIASPVEEPEPPDQIPTTADFGLVDAVKSLFSDDAPEKKGAMLDLPTPSSNSAKTQSIGRKQVYDRILGEETLEPERILPTGEQQSGATEEAPNAPVQPGLNREDFKGAPSPAKSGNLNQLFIRPLPLAHIRRL